MNRFLKQFIYFSFFCFVLFLFFGIIFFPKFRAFRARENVSSTVQFEPIEVNWVKFVNIGNNKITILSSLINPNLGFTGKFQYHFDVYSPYGNVIAKINGTSFIYGGQKKYLMEPAIKIGNEDVDRVNLLIKNISFTKEKKSIPHLKIISNQVENRNGKFYLRGQVKNEDNLPVSNIKIIAFLLDNNYLKLASSTYIEQLEGKKTVNFEIYLPNFNSSINQLPFKIWVEAEGKNYAF